MNPFDLTGRVALVTGGNGGIGLGMADGLISAGAAVMIAGRDQDKNQAAAAALRDHGGRVEAVTVDIADEASCRTMVAEAIMRFGRLDILVNNAGIGGGGRPEETPSAQWNSILTTNLTGAFIAAQAAYLHMKHQGRGKIINIGSLYAIFGGPLAAAYSASKAGIVQITKSLAMAWAPDNIQVNAVLPGWIDTDMTRRGRERGAVIHEDVVKRTPAGRWGTPQDLAGVAVFLASSASDFVTGTTITVDGGLSARLPS
jgi:2-dehydro-3-deoxy-D-gluconate 5-dehydrogenase